MKKIIIALVALGGVFAVVPYVTGYMAEQENRRVTTLLNQNSGANGELEIASYERGYTSSQVEYQFYLPAGVSAAIESQEAIKISCLYEHGMTGVDYQCGLGENEFYEKFVADYFEGKDPLTVTGSASLTGASNHVIELDSMSGVGPSGEDLSLQASKIEVQVDKTMTDFEFTGAIGDFQMDGSKGKLRIVGSEFDGSISMIGEALYTGETNFAIESMGMQSPIGEMLMKGLAFNSDIQDVGENLNMFANYSIDSITHSGEGYAVNDLDVALDLINLDKQAMIEYQKWVQDVQASMQDMGDDPDAFAMPNTAEVMPILDMALKTGLQMSLKANGNVNGGSNSLNASIKLLENLNSQELQFLIMDPDKAFKSIAMEIDANLDKGLVDASPMGAMISQNPLFQSTAEHYKSSLKLGPKSTINGQETTVMQLMGMLMPMQAQPGMSQTM